MSKPYTEMFDHFVWATKQREPMITAELEERLFGYMRGKCEELRVRVHALNGMPDHVHLACSVPPTIAVADFIEQIQGGSSHFANHATGLPQGLYWQPKYGGLTFAKHDLPRIVSYIDHQKTHHREKRLSPKMERISDDG